MTVLEAYLRRRPSGAPDELLDADGAPRTGQGDLSASIAQLGRSGLLARRAQARGLLEDDGVTYGPRPRRWDLDPLPVVLDGAQWQELERGLTQRAELLDVLLADLYGPRTMLRHGLIPPDQVGALQRLRKNLDILGVQ